MSIGRYVKQLCMIVFSSSLALGLILGTALLIVGKTSMGVDFTFDFGALDGIWLMLGLPLAAVLIFVILSPLSFLLYKLISKARFATS